MLDDRYRNLELVGEGTSAWVYRGVDTVTGRDVAIKRLKPALQTDPVTVERFRREIQITRQLGHPGIVAIYDLIHTADETALVMEFLPGPNLKQYLAIAHPLAPATAIALLTQLLEVLAACHAQNVVHRDLKPQNVIVAADGSLKVLDFGIAKMAGLGDLTQTGQSLAGSPQYMAPELFAGGRPDPRTDLYALGCIAYELFSGQPPFRGESVAALAKQHLESPPPLLTGKRALPEWLRQAVERLLAKRPFERYQTAGEVLDDLAGRRVIARELPALPRRTCPRCGGETLAELAVCLSCGWDAAALFESGGCDVLRTPATDASRLAAYGKSLFGIDQPLGRHQLLLCGVTADAAEVIRKGAAARDLPLQVRERSRYRELRKALPLAFLSMIVSGVYQNLWQRWRYSGSYLIYQLDTAQLLGFIALPVALAWVCARRFREEEIIPRWSSPAEPAVDPDLGDLRLALPPNRPPEARALIASLVERLLLLERRGPRLDPSLRAAMRDAVVGAANLVVLLSETEAQLAAPEVAQRIQHCLAVGREATAEDDAAAATLRAYYEIEERLEALHNRVIALQELFTRAVGRALVLRQPLEEAARSALADNAARLGDDLGIARAVQRELGALA